MGNTDKWMKLLSRERFIPNYHDARVAIDVHETYRRTYQKDYDRIIFSSAFRRLQGKTQVHPFPKFDYTRVRLTHSLETASVARTLGRAAAWIVLQKEPGLLDAYAGSSKDANHRYFLKRFDGTELAFIEDVATLVSAAALSHDIGNPPFGHSGEYAIREWFSGYFGQNANIIDDRQKSDFINYEGNALGFRTLTRLQGWREQGGLQVTHALLAASIKYPQTSDMIEKRKKDKETYYKKFHVFHDDKKNFLSVMNVCGLEPKSPHKDDCVFQRHPFAYLVEAADDICYLSTDIEDAAKAGMLPFEKATRSLEKIFRKSESCINSRLDQIDNEEDKLAYLRSGAIGAMIDIAIESFENHYEAILSGNFVGDLLSQSRIGKEVKEIRTTCEQQLYFGREKLIAETGGASVISSLLAKLVPAALEFIANDREIQGMQPMNARRLSVIPPSFRANMGDKYKALLSVTDYIGGMTDKYAYQLNKGLCGMDF